MDQNRTKQALRRLRIIAGQLRGLEKMLAADKYCIDILRQSLAIKEALSAFDDLIFENHLTTHVVRQIKAGKSNRAVEEILSVYKLSKRK